MNDSSEIMRTPSIRRYLLGQLSEEDQTRVEERLFTDDTLVSEIDLAEDDLIEAYMRGELSVAERERFEQHFLITPKRRRHLEVSRALYGMFGDTSVPIGSHGFMATQTRRSQPLVPWMAVAASLLISFAVTGYMARRLAQQGATANQLRHQWEQDLAARDTRIKQLESQARRDQEQLAKAQQDARVAAGKAQPDAGLLSFLLRPDFAARAEQPKSIALTIPSSGAEVQLLLDLETDPGQPYQSFRVLLENSAGHQVLSREGLRTTRGGRTLAVRVPAGLLQAGQYRLMLFGRTRGRVEQIDDYSFRVVLL